MASDNRAPSMAGTCARHVVAILFALSLTLNNSRAVLGYKEVSCAITLEGANCIGPALRLKGQSIGMENVMDGDRFTGSERDNAALLICWNSTSCQGFVGVEVYSSQDQDSGQINLCWRWTEGVFH
jgi:hypothetical protein